jgi:hypothetical protein
MGGFQNNFKKIRKNGPLDSFLLSQVMEVRDQELPRNIYVQGCCHFRVRHARIGRQAIQACPHLFNTSTSPPSSESTTSAQTRSGCLEHKFGLGVTWLRQVHQTV